MAWQVSFDCTDCLNEHHNICGGSYDCAYLGFLCRNGECSLGRKLSRANSPLTLQTRNAHAFATSRIQLWKHRPANRGCERCASDLASSSASVLKRMHSTPSRSLRKNSSGSEAPGKRQLSPTHATAPRHPPRDSGILGRLSGTSDTAGVDLHRGRFPPLDE